MNQPNKDKKHTEVDEILEQLHDAPAISEQMYNENIARAKAQLLALLESKMPERQTIAENIITEAYNNGYNQALDDVRSATRELFGSEK